MRCFAGAVRGRVLPWGGRGVAEEEDPLGRLGQVGARLEAGASLEQVLVVEGPAKVPARQSAFSSPSIV